jgi:membrane fusion protein, heavy metal efflux system
MRTTRWEVCLLLVSMLVLVSHTSCRQARANADDDGAPPPAQVVPFSDPSLFTVDHPEQYPTAAATVREATSELVVTGVVNPDVARNVPVVSLASGRVVDIYARLGDTVQKGQVLLRIRSDDVSSGFSNYRQAQADEILARAQYERTKDLYEHGAMAKADLEVAQDAEDKAKVVLETAAEHLRLLGNDLDRINMYVDINAPVSGVITDQEVTRGALVQSYGTNPFTISDLSDVWVMCDVYENDMAAVHIGDMADIHLNAYPNLALKGTVSNIGAILDPNIRTAKVRLEVRNPGMLRVGMFATATFHGQTEETHTIVPASAILHMHDRDFVYTPEDGNKFRRVEVVSGDLLTTDISLQEVKSGLKPGQKVVTNALVLDHVLGQ